LVKSKKAHVNPSVSTERHGSVVNLNVDFAARTIYLFSVIDEELAAKVVSGLKIMDESPGGITVWLNTPGGSVSDGQAIFDAIQMTTNPVTAIGTGMVASMGALLLQAADQRLATPLTRIMIHDGEAQVDGPLREVISSGKELERSMRQHFEVFVQKTGLSLKEIEAISATGRWFSAEEALEKNLIDGIVVSKDVFDKSNKDKKTARSKRTPRKRTNK